MTLLEKIEYYCSEIYWGIRIKWYDLILDPIHSIKCHLFHPYNKIEIKTLPVTWNDRDEVLLHGMFQVLCDFVEKENGLAHYRFDFSEDIIQSSGDLKESFIREQEESIESEKELNALYTYWTIDRPEMERSIDMGIKGCCSLEQIEELWDKLDDKDEEMMIRLIKIRKELWT